MWPLSAEWAENESNEREQPCHNRPTRRRTSARGRCWTSDVEGVGWECIYGGVAEMHVWCDNAMNSDFGALVRYFTSETISIKISSPPLATHSSTHISVVVDLHLQQASPRRLRLCLCLCLCPCILCILCLAPATNTTPRLCEDIHARSPPPQL